MVWELHQKQSIPYHFSYLKKEPNYKFISISKLLPMIQISK
ncbi:hypothetical protein DW691_19810 [Bacteroides xylanisolvens]|uniref:Uncharacterized protein n=1 Tax=Bacteroides xylanisolvens TaxID=371601 RepID=A0A415KLY8_9BACE|nr:hypothetical protein DW691_19810 [Bacteroides xylanisolvens]RHL37290.1 hypothetical protein DW027_12225 [Bacteroides xylanisolvens]